MADYMQVVDPRTEEEKINASDLQEIGLQQAKDKNYASGKCCDLLVASWQYSRYCGIVESNLKLLQVKRYELVVLV